MDFTFEQEVPLPLQVVFEFHADPSNMSVLYGHHPGFRLLRHQHRVVVGAQTWVVLNVFGCVPVAMGFEHTHFDPPRRFGEVIVHGPFKVFSHMHEFEPSGHGTLVRDILTIEMPWQYGGAIAMNAFVAPMVRRLFKSRAARLKRLDHLISMNRSTVHMA